MRSGVNSGRGPWSDSIGSYELIICCVMSQCVALISAVLPFGTCRMFSTLPHDGRAVRTYSAHEMTHAVMMPIRTSREVWITHSHPANLSPSCLSMPLFGQLAGDR